MSSLPLRHRQRLFAFFAVSSILYLLWRAGFTLSPEHPVYAVVFFSAEVYAVTTALVFYALVVAQRERRPIPPRAGLRVDVLIATYNEDLDLIRRTAVAARDAEYPHRTWICDDGRRPAVRSLADELGVGYLSRSSNENYKSGNLNHALRSTDGDLVVVLDADHVVRRHFLMRTLGYFHDARVALVQIPQVYYNVDSYQHVLSTRRRRLWHESSIFHHAMQPGADRHNAAFFVGTGAVLRRSALEAIGGFATESITEDIHTSMRLHAAGWRSLYVDEALGFLLAPDTPFAYALQRLRWVQGAMQILRRENPATLRGLSGWQRIGYLNSLTGYLGAYQHLLFYAAPGLLLFGGLSPIALDRPYALWVFAIHIALDLAIFLALVPRHSRLFLSECFRILNVAIYLRGSFALLRPGGIPFRVTPKGRHSGLPIALLAPSALVFLFNLTAVGVGVTRLLTGAAHPGAAALCTLFASFFAIAGALALVHAFERQGAEAAFAFPVALPADLVGQDGVPERVALRRLNSAAAWVASRRPHARGERLSLTLPGVGVRGAVSVEVTTSHPEVDPGGDTIHELRLLDLAGADRDVLDRFLFETAVPAFFAGLDGAPVGPPPLAIPGAGADGEPVESFVPLRTGIV